MDGNKGCDRAKLAFTCLTEHAPKVSECSSIFVHLLFVERGKDDPFQKMMFVPSYTERNGNLRQFFFLF